MSTRNNSATSVERLAQQLVKTSTGYGAEGVTDADLRSRRRCSPPHRPGQGRGRHAHFGSLLAVRALGVTRMGATATKAILDGINR